jgi:trimeric autotransporter adhesin
MNKYIACGIGAAAMMTLTIVVHAQASCAAAFTPGVSSIPGVEYFTSDCAFFDSGSGPRFFVTGSFTAAGAVGVSGIASWDGNAWSDVGGGLSGTGSRFCVHDDGTGPALYVVGYFTAAGGVPANHVAKWNGTSWSAVGSGLPVPGYAIVSGVLGGVPSLFASSSALASGVFRWTGTTWTQIATADHLVTSLAIEDIGSGAKLYAGGYFSNIAGIAASKIASFDGTSWQALGAGVGNPGNSTGVSACRAFGNELFVGGRFPAGSNGVSANIARWNGASWSPAAFSFPSGNDEVADLEIFDDGSGPALYASGQFPNTANFARWTGSGWTVAGGGILGQQIRIATRPGLVGFAGDFFSVNVTPQGNAIAVNRVATWNGSSWAVLGKGFNGPVNCSTTWNGELLVGGNFTQIPGGAATAGVARWNGSVWSGFGAGPPAPYPLSDVIALLPSSVGGQGLLAARKFASLSRWNGTSWQPPGSGAPVSVTAMAEYASPTGAVVVAANAAVPPQVTMWGGVNWSAPLTATGTSSYIKALASDPFVAGLLYIGGNFTSFAGLGSPNLVCWNGTAVVPPPFAWNNLEVRVMKVLDDGGGPALFIAGRNPGVPPNVPPFGPKLFRWDGTSLALIATFNPSVTPSGSYDVTDLAMVQEGAGPVLYVTGSFTTIDGANIPGVGRRIAGTWTGVPGAGLSAGWPSTVQGFQEGGGFAAYLGGGFTSFGGLPSANLARFGCPRPSISLAQGGGAGSPIFVTSSGLVLGRETFNVFSLEPCAGIPGGGPYLGLCATNPATLLNQAALPIGTPPFHMSASQSSMTFGPYLVPPVVVDALCVDFDPGLGYRWSPTVRLAIQ